MISSLRPILIGMTVCSLLSACATGSQSTPSQAPLVAPAGVDMREASWYSEQVRVKGTLYRPAGEALRPGVVLAPDLNASAQSVAAWGMRLAAEGFVALAIDYRGAGASGARIYLGERVDVYDAMRFSEHDVEIVLRRGRHDPEAQVQDIRNAVTFLQSESGVDPSRIAVMGEGLGGGHVASVMGLDARVKLGVALDPDIPGAGEAPHAFSPAPSSQAAMIRLAREGAPPRSRREAQERNAIENALLLEEYRPFWRLSDIPADAHLALISSAEPVSARSTSDARAAAALLGARGVLIEAGQDRLGQAIRFLRDYQPKTDSVRLSSQ